MSAWRERFLGVNEIPAELVDLEISEFFALSPAEVRDITSSFRTQFRIAVGIQLCFLRMAGTLLGSFRTIPKPILVHVGQQLKVDPPTIASLRAIWKRRNTRSEHHDWVMRRLNFAHGTKKQYAMLLGNMRQASRGTSSVDRLMEQSCRWLYEKNLLIPSLKVVREICVEASKDTETALYLAITKATTPEQRTEWTEKVLAPREGKRTVLEWLQQSPARRGPRNLGDLFAKIEFLKQLGIADIEFGNVSKQRMEDFARAMLRRSPTSFQRLIPVTQTLELVSFLRVRLSQLSDAVVDLSAKMTNDIVSRAGRKVEQNEAKTILTYREALSKIFDLAGDDALDGAQLKKEIIVLREAFGDKMFPSREAAVRSELAETENKSIRPLLKKLVGLDLKGKEDDQGLQGLAVLRDLYEKHETRLPEDQKSASPLWDPLIKDQTDRERAMRAFEAETLKNVRLGFRRGSLWLDHGDAYRGRDTLLISAEDWAKERSRHYRLLQVPQDVESYLGPLLKAAERGIANVAAALKRGEIHLKDDDISLEKLEAQEEPAEIASVRAMIDAEIGEVQLPEMLLEMDVATRFSKGLLGRLPRSERELMLNYSALLGVGTDMTAKAISMMVRDLSPEEILSAMKSLETDKAIDEANKLVLQYLNQLPITTVWGDGSSASSDMMSLSTSKHLWNARLDPRRQTASIGMYTHVHDRWSIIYHQPIVLGERQAGVAIEGVIRQTDLDISKLGVDTHGYTEPGMAFSRLLGFDLCPRIRNLSERRLKLPQNFAIPEALEGIAKATINLDVVRDNWDDLVRVAASISSGKISAVTALQRFGSAAQGDPIYRAAQQLGQLQLTVFLCDFFTKPEFRREITRLLNRGEHVHTLQHAIHVGSVRHDRGRHPDEMVAISGGLTLLSNLTIAWNAKRIQAAVDSLQKKGVVLSKEVLRHISPVRYAGINFRGVFSFPMDRFRAALLFETGAKLQLVRG